MEVTAQVTTEVTPEVERLLRIITGKNSRKNLQEIPSLKDAEPFRKTYPQPGLWK
jgi:ATP-dependent DNA helicase RecG